MEIWAHREWIQLKLHGSWVKAGQDLIPQWISCPQRVQLPKLVREPDCFLPQAFSTQQPFCFVWTVCGWWLGAVWQRPRRALEADSPWQGGWLTTSPSQGQRTCRFSKRPPASINYRGWGGMRRNNCTLFKMLFTFKHKSTDFLHSEASINRGCSPGSLWVPHSCS